MRRLLPSFSLIWLVTVLAATSSPASAEAEQIELPFTAYSIDFDDASGRLIVATSGETQGPCFYQSLRIIDLAGSEQHRIEEACSWLVDDGVLFVSSFDSIRSFSIQTGEQLMEWHLPENRRARAMIRAGSLLYFDEETLSPTGWWLPSGIGLLEPGVENSLTEGLRGDVRLGAVSNDERFLWVIDPGGSITRIDQSGEAAPVELPDGADRVSYYSPPHLSADEQHLYYGATMVDAHTLQVVSRGGNSGNEGYIERSTGHVLQVRGLNSNGFVTAFALGTLDEIASSGYVADANANNGVIDAIVVQHPTLGERLALATNDRIVFQTFAPELGQPSHPIEAGVARTVTLGASWIEAVESMTIGGTPLAFRPIDYDYNGRTDAFEVDIPELPQGRHLVRIDGPLGPSADTSGNYLVVEPAQPRTALDVLVRADSRPGDVNVFISCIDPNARFDESPDIYRSHRLASGERITYHPVIGHTCNINVERAEDPDLPLGYDFHLTAGFFDPTQDRDAEHMVDLELTNQELVMTAEPLGFGVFVPDPEETVLWTYAYGIGQVPDGERTVTIDCPGESPVTYSTHYGWWRRTVVPSRLCTVTHPKPAGAEFSGWTEIELHLGTIQPVRNENATRGVGHGPAVGLVALDVYPHPSEHNGAFVRQQYLDFLGRQGDPGGLAHWEAALNNGSRARTDLVQLFLDSPEFGGTVAPVNRLYQAYFDRAPDRSGLYFWVDWIRSGRSLSQVSDEFARSAEFDRTYGSLNDEDFIDLVYENVLGRLPDADGRAFWVDQMANGLTRGQLMVNFSESAEFIEQTRAAVLVDSLYQGLLQRSPDPQGFAFWTGQVDAGQPIDALIAGMLSSQEYYDRFDNIVEPLPTGAARVAHVRPAVARNSRPRKRR